MKELLQRFQRARKVGDLLEEIRAARQIQQHHFKHPLASYDLDIRDWSTWQCAINVNTSLFKSRSGGLFGRIVNALTAS